ncbi:MAG TPA: hypothetical protein VKT82_11310 [Ktedonobacterales bacterium]|nr:hypothetical protein [Ktedonobacterales bacterium]
MGATVTLDAQLELIERLDRAPLEAERRGELATITGAVAGLRLGKVDRAILSRRIRAMYGDILRESPFLEELIDELQPEIKAEAEAKGMAKGMRKMAQVALEGRFGALSDDMLAALEASSQETLEDIVGHISTDTLEQARARLGLK